MKKIRVRYAPSPTGNLHIGGARTALINYLFCKKYKGDFIIRIEDTDSKRNIKNGESSQINNLEWLGLKIDESPSHPGDYGPYRQSERNNIYQKYIKELLSLKKIYHCFCSPEELDENRKNQKESGILNPQYNRKCLKLTFEEIDTKLKNNQKYALRLKIEDKAILSWNDLVRNKVSFFGKDVGDIIIVKNNGVPTYNFAVVIDDYLMKITHIFRGEEHISNTPKQIFIYQIFGWELPKFGHLTIISDLSGKKLSKRDESIDQFISQYRKKGFINNAIFNFLAFLGWSPEGEKEIFSPDELINLFDEKRLSKSPSCFDSNKLEWTNSVYIKKLSNKKYLELTSPFAKEGFVNFNQDQKDHQEILLLYKNEIKYGMQIINKIKLFFESEISFNSEAKIFLQNNPSSKLFEIFKNQIEKISNWNTSEIEQAFKNTQNISQQKGKKLFMPIRARVTGRTHGPDIKKTLFYLGKERVLRQL